MDSMKPERLASRNVVLMGIGHTNAHVVRMWRMKAFPDTSLTCISDRPVATYSGMLPAVLAGQIPQETMQIDLVRLCASVGARLIVDRVVGLDRAEGLVHFESRPSIPFDALSIGIGSVPSVGALPKESIEGPALLRIKPMQTFLKRLSKRVEEVRESSEPLRAVVVGSGVAGIEILFCVREFLDAHGFKDADIRLVSRSDTILKGALASTQTRIMAEINRRGHEVCLNRSVTSVEHDSKSASSRIVCSDGTELSSNLIIWATGATSPPGLAGLDLPLDESGFVSIDHTLRTTDANRVPEKSVFAVGDTGTIVGENLPKAGVYAVRQGPILWRNLRSALDGKPLRKYQPQRSFMSLINMGDGRAVGEWKGRTFVGRWVYMLKNRIDSKFMEKFEPVVMEEDPSEPMQCHGCGCKLGVGSLEQVIRDIGTETGIVPDDAAAIGGDANSNLWASTDFFTNPVDDAYLFGRITAIHSASDLVATGTQVTEALGNVVVPEGDRTAQQQVLKDFLAGASEEFTSLGAKIVGGHTIVGPRFEAGFTVIGKSLGEGVLAKAGLRAGDKLYLTKPIGVGVLLAAYMRSKLAAEDYMNAIELMLRPQHRYAYLAVEAGICAATDVTGFGLVGHLQEMLSTSQASARLRLSSIPTLKAAEQCVQQGIESSLVGDNLENSRHVRASEAIKALPSYRLSFDPQTCGGLLFGVPQASENAWLDSLEREGLAPPANIGTVEGESGTAMIHLSD